ncbi:MAG: CDP-alcohol phosphatidyltransferase family protein [Candidatus Aenigmarchaeota archaeon]|nr:CDP-alcohol phosphatidyltransferase family protein [Candidatus Aenigmarchaeota archaeon]
MLNHIEQKHPKMRRKLLAPFIININPNKVTLAALVSAFLSGYYFYVDNLFAAAFFLVLNGFLDVLDGEIAKKSKAATKRGDFLDHTCDRISDTAIFVGLAHNPIMPTEMTLMALICVLLVSYLGTQAQALTTKRMYGGVMGRAERGIILFAAAITTSFFTEVLLYSLYLIIILSAVTFLQRFYALYKNLGT